jgi:hypothetical protein
MKKLIFAHLFKFFFAACENAKVNAASTFSQKLATEQGEIYHVQNEKSEYMCRSPYKVSDIYGKIKVSRNKPRWPYGFRVG